MPRPASSGCSRSVCKGSPATAGHRSRGGCWMERLPVTFLPHQRPSRRRKGTIGCGPHWQLYCSREHSYLEASCIFGETPPALTPMLGLKSLSPRKTRCSVPSAISPDGRKTGFQCARPGRADRFVDPIDGFSRSASITGNRGSESGSDLVARQPIDRISGRWQSPKSWMSRGGTPQILAPYTNPATGIAWSRDDVILFGRAGMIHRIPAWEGEAIPITAVDSRMAKQAWAGHPSCRTENTSSISSVSWETRVESYVGSIDAKSVDQGKFRLLDSPAGVAYTYLPRLAREAICFSCAGRR